MRIQEFMLVASLLAAVATTTSGCTGQHLPEQGYSVKQAIALQILNPDAGGTDPVTGLDGKYAASAMDNYQKLPQPAESTKSLTLGSLFSVGEGK